jgi:hypothetical protein
MLPRTLSRDTSRFEDKEREMSDRGVGRCDYDWQWRLRGGLMSGELHDILAHPRREPLKRECHGQAK